MRKIFEQSERIDQKDAIVHVYCNNYKEVFIGNVDAEYCPCFVFTPEESIIFAREVIKVAKQIKNSK